MDVPTLIRIYTDRPLVGTRYELTGAERKELHIYGGRLNPTFGHCSLAAHGIPQDKIFSEKISTRVWSSCSINSPCTI